MAEDRVAAVAADSELSPNLFNYLLGEFSK